MKEIYIVKYSRGSYEDYREIVTETCFFNYPAAEAAKDALDKFYAEDRPFPFDWCKEEEFLEMMFAGKAVNEDIDTFNVWDKFKEEKEEYTSAWVQTLNLIE